MVRQAPVICVMAPPFHLGAWSMALMLWLPFELLLLLIFMRILELGGTSSPKIIEVILLQMVHGTSM